MIRHVDSPETDSANDLTPLLSLLNKMEILVERGHGVMGVKLISENQFNDLLDRLRRSLPRAVFEVDTILEQQAQIEAQMREQAHLIIEHAKREAAGLTDLARRQAAQRIEDAQAQRQLILSEAARKSQVIVDDATRQSEQLVQSHPVVVSAQQASRELRQVTLQETSETRAWADHYALRVLEKAEAAFLKLQGPVREGQALLRPAMISEGLSKPTAQRSR